MAEKIELLRLSSNVSSCLRKKKIRSRNDINAGNLSNNDFIYGLVQHDDAYRVLAAEALALPYAEKSRLIQLDSVTCARYFNYRYQEQRKLWDLPGGPFKGIAIAHSYYRVAFQQRGSPHIHQLLRLSEAPVFDTVSGQNEREVCSYIGRFITCSSTADHQDQQRPSRSPHYLEFQYHRHTATCGKRRTGKCRFGIPFYPMRRTRILRPLPEDTDEQERERLARVLKRINGVLTDYETLHNASFDEFLEKCEATKEYLRAVRAELRRCKVFLRRIPSDILINPYSPKILSTMRSNMDLEYVLDPCACAPYIID
ncbi:unnamed protein product [Gongylonema pulchrum]|uniref:Helitron_like_N domain-containing protein n=1 Tax=Gongylonema pulchrum TaxID=637853 RepID=A0A183E3Z4_9BILA|nr:unnamed protein product [Gongylonema pulchrum]